MTRYVSLSTDAPPRYSVFAPIVARMWRQIGYRAIIHVHDRGWDSDYGRTVLAELAAVDAAIVTMPDVAPLSTANTMRSARLVAACQDWLEPHDFILTADVDMFPLDRAFFSDPAPWTVLRSHFAAWLACPQGRLPPPFDPAEIRWGNFRFQMCYAGAEVWRWRTMLGLVPGAPVDSLAAIAASLAGDCPDLDESVVSHRFLTFDDAAATMVRPGLWHKGDLVMIEPVDAPQLHPNLNIPRGMISNADAWAPGRGPKPEGAIDMIPSRFSPGVDQPWWAFEAAGLWYPEEREWLGAYCRSVGETIGGAKW